MRVRSTWAFCRRVRSAVALPAPLFQWLAKTVTTRPPASSRASTMARAPSILCWRVERTGRRVRMTLRMLSLEPGATSPRIMR